MMKEKKRKSLTGSFTSFTLKACSIKKRRVFRYLRPISIGDFVTEMEWQPLVSANQEQYMTLNVTTDFYWCIDMPWLKEVLLQKFLNHSSIDTDQLDAIKASALSNHAWIDITML